MPFHFRALIKDMGRRMIPIRMFIRYLFFQFFKFIQQQVNAKMQIQQINIYVRVF